ncbi:hypothetical protein C8R46DRAFT_1114628 [Mycena filopes]|nr:hypothetical protein C8R46DRAFT_1114628 [Mycena filopes]
MSPSSRHQLVGMLRCCGGAFFPRFYCSPSPLFFLPRGVPGTCPANAQKGRSSKRMGMSDVTAPRPTQNADDDSDRHRDFIHVESIHFPTVTSVAPIARGSKDNLLSMHLVSIYPSSLDRSLVHLGKTPRRTYTARSHPASTPASVLHQLLPSFPTQVQAKLNNQTIELSLCLPRPELRLTASCQHLWRPSEVYNPPVRLSALPNP